MAQVSQLLNGAVWNVAGKLVQFALSLVTLGVIARFVGPQAYGVFSLTWIVIGLVEIVVAAAPIDTLVQRKEVTTGHQNATWRASMAIALLAWGALTLSAGLIDSWLHGGILFLTLLPMRAASLPLSALAVVPTAMLMRQSRFKAIAAVESSAGVAASVTGLSLALTGAGVWSLLGMELVRSAVSAAMMLRLSGWRPRWTAGRSDFTDLLGFNASTWATWGLGYIDEQVPRALIGATLGAHALGCYGLADRLLGQIANVLMVPAYQVVSAGVARNQHDLVAVRALMAAALRLSALVACPLFLGLCAVAASLVPLLFGPAWTDAIVVVQILMLMGIRSSMGMIQIAAIRGLGKPNWHLWIGLIGVACSLAGVSVGLRWGLTGVAVAMVLRSLLISPLHSMLVARLVGMPIGAQYSALLASLLGAIPMAVIVFLADRWLQAWLPPLSALSLLVVIGGCLYWFCLRLFAPKIAHLGEQMLCSLLRRDRIAFTGVANKAHLNG